MFGHNKNDEGKQILQSAIDAAIGVELKKKASEESQKIDESSLAGDSTSVQQSTLAYAANTQAIKANNEEKQKTLTVDQAINNAIQESLKQRNEMLVYHGTGADFNKFALNKMGSGEGSQTYGEGVYFTSSKKIATDYAESPYNKSNEDFSLIKHVLDDGVEKTTENLVKEFDYINQRLEKLKKEITESRVKLQKDGFDDDFIDTMLKYREKSVSGLTKDLEPYNRALELVNNGSIVNELDKTKALLYSSAIPNDNGRNYFDWETGYSFNRLLNNENLNGRARNHIEFLQKYDDSYKDGYIGGGELYKELRDKFGQEVATQSIKDMGYKGIKYPAGLIHGGAEKGDTNYVVFNEDDIRIIKKEDLLASKKESFLDAQGQDSSIIQTVQYVDQSLKELADSFNKTIHIIESGNSSFEKGSTLVNPSATEFHKIGDGIVKANGEVVKIAPEDWLLATTDPAKFIEKYTSEVFDLVKTKIKEESKTWEKDNSNNSNILDRMSLKVIVENQHNNRINDKLKNDIENANEKQRLQEWLYNHPNERVEKNNNDIIELRDLKSEFDSLLRYISHEVNDSGISTLNERGLLNSSRNYSTEIDHNLDLLDDRSKKIGALEDKLNQENLSDEERTNILKTVNILTEDYNSILKQTISTYEEANESVKKGLEVVRKENRNIEDPAVLRRKEYNNAKYAFFRTEEQTRMLQRSGYLSAFDTTGNLLQSAKKAVFNRAVGLRQQRGLVGFAANAGFNAFGNVPAIALGTFAKGLKVAEEAVLRFSKGAVEAYGQLETVKTNLGIVYGSQSEANTAFNEIAQYATKSPFGVETVSQFAVQLKQSGVYASELMTVLKEIGDVAGGNQQKFGNIANAFAQIEANGKATTRQLREFATAGIPIYAQLSKQLGKSIEQIRSMTTKGQISSSVIEQAFAQLTGEGGMFHNAVNIGARTWAARNQNLQDAKQLAQAQMGQWMINFGGTSSTDNDSFAKSVLTFLEELLGSVENFFLLKNIAKDVSAIEGRNEREEELKYAIEKAKSDKDKELAKLLEDKLDKVSLQRNLSQERASNAQAVSLYIEARDKADSIIENRNEYINGLDNLNKKRDSGFKNQKEEEDYLFLQGEMGRSISELSDEIEKFERQARKTIKYFRDDAKLSDYYISKVEAYTQKGFDNLDSIAKKGIGIESAVGTPNSLYKMYQQSVENQKQTAKGKLKIERQAEEEWEQMRKKYDELVPYLNKTAILTKDNVISIDKLSELMNSGIINPLNMLTYTPEKMSDSKTLAKISGRSVEENTNDWKYAADKVRSLTAIDVSNLSKKEIKAFQDLFVGMYGGKREDYTTKIDKNGNKVFEENSNFEQELKNSETVVRNFNKVFVNFIEVLSKDNEELASFINQYLSVRAETVDKAGAYADEHTLSATPYPLWQRIISSTLGVDLSLFKNTGNGKGWAANGNQALQLYQKQMEKQTIKSVLQATLSSMGSKNGFSIIGDSLVYGKKAGVVANNSKDGTTQIDWKKTYENVAEFSMAMESSAEITRAYADALSQSQSALEEFLTSSITQMEEPANIWDDNYQEVLGKYAKNIEAVDANAFDMMFERVDGGFLKMRENAVEAAKNLYQLTESTAKAASAMAEMKEEIKGIKSEKATSDTYNQLIIGNHGRSTLFGGMDYQESLDFSKELISKLVARTTTEGDLLYGLNAGNLFQSYMDNRTVGRDSSIVDRSAEADINKKIEEAEKRLESAQVRINTKIYEDNYKSAMQKEQLYSSSSHSNAATLEEYKEATRVAKEQLDIANAINANNKATEENIKLQLENYTNTKNSIISGLNAEEGTIENKNKVFETLDQLFTEMLNRQRSNATQTSLTSFYQVADPFRSWDSELLGGTKRNDTGMLQQYVLNKGGYTGSWGSFRNSMMADENGNINMDFIKQFMENVGNGKINLRDEQKSLFDALSNEYYGENPTLSMFEGTEEGLKPLLDLFDQLILKQMELGEASNSTALAFKDLGKSSMDALKSGLVNGYNQTMQKIGDNARKLNDGLIDSEDASENLNKIWKEVGVDMLNTIGANMTNAGLALIQGGALANDKGMIIAGAAMVAAGGVTQIAGGFLGGDDSKEKDKQKQEEERLKSLRDLLKEIIDQAKTDAQYYENNMRHQNALSVQAVNDAIITPNGSVVTTHPDDYLIATKTPGALIGSNNSNKTTNVSLTVVNASGTPVEAKEKSRKTDKDGNVEIELMLTSIVGQKIADGSMDGFFNARDQRLSGKTYFG